ncbi:DUF2268 domain-containing putative Zn-dependent protease [uncultured Dokdonia sp.]|uniref:DUF2268 domain-containing putative Zn-dependent protease n=1 Tax=uncultured Dokdonia sp. TaxID=575653 RepID=UPI00262CD0B1|nr:DUF2268 domain-containing putative Zn-dependent protease [uncultured Dokdonia sp.]
MKRFFLFFFLIYLGTLQAQNSTTVQTKDITHFWEAFDALSTCKTNTDSIQTMQRLYLDRATRGLKDFAKVRDFTADGFVEVIATYPKYYQSIRANTLTISKILSELEGIVTAFKNVYPRFEEKGICFAIGMLNTGGTISEDFLLIGSEIAASTNATDLSEIDNDAFKKVLSSGTSVKQKIRNMIAHEYVHTQQKIMYSDNAVKCSLLKNTLEEGQCDFIGELLAGGQINTIAKSYGDQHEEALWNSFKNELCNVSDENWLYNFTTVKEEPADLGYYIGYQITKSYYEQAIDKQQAIIDILEMDNPLHFLQMSGYDQKFKD